jgi:hypothetical protein
MTDKIRFALYLNTNNPNGVNQYFEARPVEVVDHPTALMPNGDPRPSIRNLISDWDREVSSLRDLSIHAWVGGDYRNRFLSSFYTTYRDVYEVDLRRAEEMESTLRKINRALVKAEARDGDPANFGQYLMRVARALGIKDVIVKTGGSQFQSDYDRMEFRMLTLVEGAARANLWIQNFLNGEEREIGA